MNYRTKLVNNIKLDNSTDIFSPTADDVSAVGIILKYTTTNIKGCDFATVIIKS